MSDSKSLLSKLKLEDLKELEKELQDTNEEDMEEEEREKYRVVRSIIEKLESGGPVHEAVRDAVFDAVKSSFDDSDVFEFDDEDPYAEKGADLVAQKRQELYDILDNLDEHIAGKDLKDVAAFFSSLLDIQGQLCMQKTEGVITVRTRLYNFFVLPESEGTVRPELKQEISLIFSPEEIQAIRMKLPDLPEDDPMKPFYTVVLDQAYDVVQYNEMSGNLLLEMTNYFLMKLDEGGFGDHPKVSEYRERHSRCKISLKKALDDLRGVEIVINNHLRDRPVLMELPKCLRALIQIKLGLLDKKHTQKVLQKVYNLIGDYARARSAVAFDFNRLPSYQHGVRLRQSVILNLQKDVLQFSGEQFEKEFQAIKEEMERMLAEIEAQSEHLDPNSPEFEEMMKRKEMAQRRIETARKKLDVVRSQQTLVDVQHTLVNEAVKRYQQNEANYKKLEEELKSRPKEKLEVRKVSSASTKKKPNRMVMARRSRG